MLFDKDTPWNILKRKGGRVPIPHNANLSIEYSSIAAKFRQKGETSSEGKKMKFTQPNGNTMLQGEIQVYAIPRDTSKDELVLEKIVMLVKSSGELAERARKKVARTQKYLNRKHDLYTERVDFDFMKNPNPGSGHQSWYLLNGSVKQPIPAGALMNERFSSIAAKYMHHADKGDSPENMRTTAAIQIYAIPRNNQEKQFVLEEKLVAAPDISDVIKHAGQLVETYINGLAKK